MLKHIISPGALPGQDRTHSNDSYSSEPNRSYHERTILTGQTDLYSSDPNRSHERYLERTIMPPDPYAETNRSHDRVHERTIIPPDPYSESNRSHDRVHERTIIPPDPYSESNRSHERVHDRSYLMAGTDRNHSTDSYSSEPNRSHERTIYSNGPFMNGHIPNRQPNGHPPNMNTSRAALSTLSTSKHSLGGRTTSSVSPGVGQPATPKPPGPSRPQISRSPTGSILIPNNITTFITKSKEVGVKEMLTSLGLLCLVSLLLALLSLIFLLKITPVTAAEMKDFLRTDHLTIISPEEYVVVYEVTLALCSLTLSLNLCCLLVCAVQFLFAVKLVRAGQGGERTNKYLQKSNITRIVAVGGFFISIPVFLTGIILYTFIQFHSTPAIITSSLIGAGIIYCGCAMVHNVFVWQMEKTNAVRELARHTQAVRAAAAATTSTSAGTTPEDLAIISNMAKSSFVRDPLPHSPSAIPPATIDLSNIPHELSTLV